MAISTSQIISEMRQKISEGGGEYSDIKIGVEQKFVGPLRNSHNNNMEEQFLLGVDNIKTTWETETDYIEKIEYRTRDVIDKYYILESYFHKDLNYNVDINNSRLSFHDSDLVKYGINSLIDKIGENFMTYNDNILTIYPDCYGRTDYLKFVSDGEEYIISTREVTVRTDPEGKVITRTVIKQGNEG